MKELPSGGSFQRLAQIAWRPPAASAATAGSSLVSPSTCGSAQLPSGWRTVTSARRRSASSSNSWYASATVPSPATATKGTPNALVLACGLSTVGGTRGGTGTSSGAPNGSPGGATATRG